MKAEREGDEARDERRDEMSRENGELLVEKYRLRAELHHDEEMRKIEAETAP
jgi:hypothetical protein